MAIILFVGYLGLIVYNLRQKDGDLRIDIPWLLAIGILVQLGWETGLRVGGIRSAGFASFGEKLRTLVVNSLLETNLGMSYIYAIFLAFSRGFNEDLTRREKISFADAIRENNAKTVKFGSIRENL